MLMMIKIIGTLFCVYFVGLSLLTKSSAGTTTTTTATREEERLRIERVHYRGTRPSTVFATFDESEFIARADKVKEYMSTRTWAVSEPDDGQSCPYDKISELSDIERHPIATKTRHMVDPPPGGRLQLVCCHTTAGPMSIAVHHKWAPLGAARFIEMVESGYFNFVGGAVPFMRCIAGFLCQFGLNSNPELTKLYKPTIEDDPNWLPEGPSHRENSIGVKRFAKGYLAYAGGGKDSRDNQFIMALENNGPLAGGSPWEVPWGELVGSESYESLEKITTRYGEGGPSQQKLHNIGMTDNLRREFGHISFITWCSVVDTVDDDDLDDGAVDAPTKNGTTLPVVTPP
jgi:peptidyl-prolyl cis-trans isomerase A (cyclophilin A)